MWKAKIVKKVIIRGQLTVGVEFSKGEVTFRENFVNSDGNLDVQVQILKRIAELEKLETLLASIVEGDFDDTPPVITPEPDPTPEEIKKKEYRDKLNELSKKQKFVDLKIIDDADLTTLRTEVKQLATDLGEI